MNCCWCCCTYQEINKISFSPSFTLNNLTSFGISNFLNVFFSSCHQIVRLSCRRRRTKTLIVGDTSADSTKYACANSAACAKFCSCCACSAACCITCCSCFPFCNLYSCLRSFFCGSQVHPATGNGAGSKAEFYIGGIAQDRDAQIVYLTNELREVFFTPLLFLGQNITSS